MTNHDIAPITQAGSSPSGLKAHPNRAFRCAAFRLAASMSTPYVAVIAANVRPSFVTLSRYRLQSIAVRLARMSAGQHCAPDSSSLNAVAGFRRAPRGERPARLSTGRASSFRRVPASGGSRAPWRVPSQPLAAPEGRKALILQGGERGQDKGRQCAEPLRLGCGLDSQGFWPLLRNVRGDRAMCRERRTPAGIRVWRTLRSAAP